MSDTIFFSNKYNGPDWNRQPSYQCGFHFVAKARGVQEDVDRLINITLGPSEVLFTGEKQLNRYVPGSHIEDYIEQWDDDVVLNNGEVIGTIYGFYGATDFVSGFLPQTADNLKRDGIKVHLEVYAQAGQDEYHVLVRPSSTEVYYRRNKIYDIYNTTTFKGAEKFNRLTKGTVTEEMYTKAKDRGDDFICVGGFDEDAKDRFEFINTYGVTGRETKADKEEEITNG